MNTVRILIADDHPVLCRGLATLLKAHAGWKVAATATNGREAVEKTRHLRPDVIVLDISMPELNGLDASRMIMKKEPRSRIILLTMHNDDDLIAKAVQCGVRGYVLKTEAEKDLLNAVEAVLAGRTFLPADCSDLLFSPADRQQAPKARKGQLSLRESQVVNLLAEGRRNKEIASELGISTRTAENHRARIMQKLGFHSLSEVVKYAIRNKMVAT